MTPKLVLDSDAKRIGYLSTYPPRECGIANFTKDLIDAISELNGFKHSIIAINEKGAIYDYDRRVKWVIERDDAEDYVKAAEYVNSSNIQLVVIQHEFGLFGGDYGEHLKLFLENVKKPVITTLHTVQPNFDKKPIEVLKYIIERSESIIVIAHAAIDMLKNQGIPHKKCVVIPHGCPNVDLTKGKSIKESLGLKERLVASTFGLISSGKGIEYAIQALPEVIKKEPRIIYLIIGETHPEVRKHEGEKYRNELTRLVSELGLEENVRFTNRFITKRELIKYLQATDIYLTPYISPNQISSGTLIYALGAGKAVVSTPYYHAQEVLAHDRGILCKFEDSASIAEGINRLLDENFRNEVQKKAYKYSRRFLWKNVAKKYVNLIKSIIENNEAPKLTIIPIKLDYVRTLTDDVGMLQHSKYATPNKKEGYTTDDNARALIACTNYLMLFNDASVKGLIDTYLCLLLYMQKSDGKMHNYLGYDRKLLDETGSEDCMGRTLWACGYCLNSKLPEETKLMSKEIFDKVFKWTSSFTSPRAKAYSIMGLYNYQKAYPNDQNVKLNIVALADQLTKHFELESSKDWDWFESYLTYSNSRLPHSLFLAYEATGKNQYLQVAAKSMKFLINTQTINDIFVPIGNRGWYRKGSTRSIYDQQSVEASCTTEAAIAAFRNTSEDFYLKAAYDAFEWFFGRNLQGLVLYDPENGSCSDGITPEGLNQNKGAESTLAYLQARLNLEEIKT